jgi:hypothetical protein
MDSPSDKGNKLIDNHDFVEEIRNILITCDQQDSKNLHEKQEKVECELAIQNLNEKIDAYKETLITVMSEEYIKRFV